MITTRFLTYEQLLSMMPEKEIGSANLRREEKNRLLAQHVYNYGYLTGLDVSICIP